MYLNTPFQCVNAVHKTDIIRWKVVSDLTGRLGVIKQCYCIRAWRKFNAAKLVSLANCKYLAVWKFSIYSKYGFNELSHLNMDSEVRVRSSQIFLTWFISPIFYSACKLRKHQFWLHFSGALRLHTLLFTLLGSNLVHLPCLEWKKIFRLYMESNIWTRV